MLSWPQEQEAVRVVMGPRRERWDVCSLHHNEPAWQRVVDAGLRRHDGDWASAPSTLPFCGCRWHERVR